VAGGKLSRPRTSFFLPVTVLGSASWLKRTPPISVGKGNLQVVREPKLCNVCHIPKTLPRSPKWEARDSFARQVFRLGERLSPRPPQCALKRSPQVKFWPPLPRVVSISKGGSPFDNLFRLSTLASLKNPFFAVFYYVCNPFPLTGPTEEDPRLRTECFFFHWPEVRGGADGFFCRFSVPAQRKRFLF